MRARSCLSCLAIAACFHGAFAANPAAAPNTTSILPQHSLATRYYGNDAPWFEKKIPFFDCSDPHIARIYYYRWQLYKSHLKDLGDRGYIITEFLDDVPWALKPFQSLNDATAFHINEGRWLRDNRYLDDYINFMYDGGNDRHFSEAIAAAVYGRYLANGDRAFAIRNLDAMKRIFRAWTDRYDPAKGLYFIAPIADATEYSVASIDASGGTNGFLHGDAFRPTINSFMFANAVAVSKLAALAGDTNAEATFASNAAALRSAVETNLWNDHLQHFTDRFKADNQFVHYWDLIRARELAGYVPWTFELPDNDPKYNASWKHLLSPDGFAGPYGLRTVEPGYEYYMKQYRYVDVNGSQSPECQWNGPTWPFDTTLVLTGMANLLNDYTQNVVRAEDYVGLLKQYTRQHFLNGQPDLQEDYNPDSGRVIVGLPRSHHYNHSSYNDLIITGLVGLRPRADNTLEINPLIPTDPHATNSIDYFCLESVPYHGQSVTILYDRDGRHYHRGTGLSVYVNGRQVLAPAPLGRKLIAIAEPTVRATFQPIDLAVNYARKGFPAPSASINNSANDLFKAVDGRVYFYPNVGNYWSNTGSDAASDWFSVDFGAEKQLGSVQLYFYADKTEFKAPVKCVVQYWTGQTWSNVSEARATPRRPLANGENTLTFRPVNSPKLRILFTNPPRAAIALVELKAFTPPPSQM
ncbi:MAG TPA: discoidin domain-containing protein [Verrucomicrobiae bacterium]|nr:discoidin domain-containing protein [Verrucomicrobiae bacterium]